MDTKEFAVKMLQVIEGYNIASKIISSDNETTHYIIQNRHIGDTTRNLKLLKPFKEYYSGKTKFYFEETGFKNYKMFKKNFVVEKIVVITNFFLSGAVRLFPEVDETIVLSSNELNALELYANSSICCHITLHADEDRDNWMKAIMFGIPSICWKWRIPNNLPLGMPVITDKLLLKGKEFIKVLNIDPQKTVILCPYAKSSTSLNNDVWDKIVNLYISMGYIIFTNTGPNEEAFDGTKKLELPVDELVCLVHLGCEIFGIQSGLVDTIVWSGVKTRMTIIFNIKRHQERQYALNRGVFEQSLIKENITYLKFENEEDNKIFEIIKSTIEINREDSTKR